MAMSQYSIEFNMKGLEKLKTFQDKLKHATKRVRELTEAQAKREAKGRTDTKVYQKQAKTLANFSRKQKELKLDINATTESLKRNSAMMTKQHNSSMKAAKGAKAAGRAMAAMGLSVAGAAMAVRRLATFMVDSLKSFAEFEKGVKNVTTLLSAEDTALFRGDLFKGALAVSTEYGFALKDVNKAMFNAVSAGVKGADAINFLNEASVLAVAGVTDLKSATLGLTTVLNAYGMEMTEADRISEILFTTQKFGVTTVSELSKAIGVVVPFAAASGISMEELGASIAVTTRSGLDAAKTVTALRAAISQMQKPAAESRDLFIKWGIPIGAAQMKAVGYTETLRRLNKVYRDSPRDIELMFGNVRGLTAIFSLAGDNAEQYADILKEVVSDTGEASSIQKALAENSDSAAMELAKLGTAWSELKVTIGDSQWMRDMVTTLTSFIRLLSSEDVSSGNKKILGLLGTLDTFAYILSFAQPASYVTDGERGTSFTEMYMNYVGNEEEIAKAERNTEDAIALMEETNERIQVILSNIRGASTTEGYTGFDSSMVKDMGDILSATSGVALPDEQQDILDEFQVFLDNRNQLIEGANAKAALASDIAGAQAQAFDKRELEKRQNTIDAVNDIKTKALETDEYVNETSLKISKAKLKEALALQASLDEVDSQGLLKMKASAEQEQKIANEIAALQLKIKQQTIINERKNSKDYDDKVIKAKKEMEKNIHDITLKGIKDGESADEIKLKTLSEKKKFYDTILGFAGKTEDEYANTLKNLSKIEIDFLKLGDKMVATDSPKYLETKRQALLYFNEQKAIIQKKEIDGEITAQEAKRQILVKEFEMYQALSTHSGQGANSRIKNIEKMTEIEIAQMFLKRDVELEIHQQKLDITMQGLQASADFAEQLGQRSLDNFMKRQGEEKKSLKEKLDSGKISEEQYDRHIESLEKKAFERKKKQEQGTARIAYLMELANIAVQAAANKANAWTWGAAGLKQYAALAAIASARFIGTTATIASQKFADGGMVYGNSHSQGGEKFAVGGRVVELEGGEAVINKRSSSMFRNELSAINVAGGGVDFSRGARNFNAIDYNLLAKAIGQNTNVVLPVESLNQVQNRVKTIEDGSKF
ncbi:phage tail tape measure protein [uncultured Mediterranean phage uvMED]|nr:phage tail tape measure protein [uncultured Mediterranean phage uvMED]